MGLDERHQSRSPSKPVVVITGAGNGIGRASCLALGKIGYRVGLIDRDGSALARLVEEFKVFKGDAYAAEADVRDSMLLKSAIDSIEARLGPTETLITCAGVGKLSSAENLDVDGLQWMFDINVLGMARSIDAVAPGMFVRKRGHIIGIASVAGYRGLPWMPGYCATKAAVTNYLEALRPAFKLRGVRISTLYPGFVATGLTLETPFRYPVKMLTADQAARFVVMAVEKRPRDYVFPFSARLGMGFLSRLPTRLFDRLMERAGPKALYTDF